jgi:hypothetical protein
MSSLLFLIAVAGFVLIAYWAYRNDVAGLGEHGTGLLAMRATNAPKTKAGPKWKKEARPAADIARRLGAPKASDDKKPRWNQTFLPGRDR